MLVPLEWLNEYTKIDAAQDEFCERMIMSGSNIESVERFDVDIEGVVVGKILGVEEHPNADKLVVCKVDVGAGRIVQICTGSPNIDETQVGAYVPVALDGARVPGPLHGRPKSEGGDIIESGELRGVMSEGMMCSCSELGFDAKLVPYSARDGVWILEGEYEPGTDIVKALGLDDVSVDFEITPNRPDCLSIIGMAREASAVFGSALEYPDTECVNFCPEEAASRISVEIKKPELCKRYCCRVVKDVKIAPSPWWMQRRLMLAGMRPINNIVDITNYVMLEYGQPLHAFDINTVRGGKIIIDTAGEGEKFTTLDGSERTLNARNLTIRDAEGAIAVAGVMGGLDSDIAGETNTVLIESANFQADSVRRTSKDLGLRTEASSRFEKGIDPNLAKAACDRVCRLIEMLGAGTVLSGDVDAYPVKEEARPIDVRVSRINLLLGTDLSAEEMVSYLRSLEMEASYDGDIISVTPPTIRRDLEIEEDYAEEVARLYGYDKLPMRLPKSNNLSTISRKQSLRNITKQALLAMGLSEFQTYSFVSPKASDKLRIPEENRKRSFVKLINPLGEETSVMRTTILSNLLEVLSLNNARSNPEAKGFELGNTFFADVIVEDVLPEEKDSLCIALYGEGEDFFSLKGRVEQLMDVLGIDDIEFEAESDNPTFHPGRCAKLLAGGKVAGVLGQVHPAVCENFNLEERKVFAAELDIDMLYGLADTEMVYNPLPKYPAMTRDFSMVVTEDVAVGELQKAIRMNAGDLLESVKLFDIYRGAPVPEGSKSVAFSLTYRSAERTLKEAEVNEINQKVLIAIKDAYNAVLREM